RFNLPPQYPAELTAHLRPPAILERQNPAAKSADVRPQTHNSIANSARQFPAAPTRRAAAFGHLADANRVAAATAIPLASIRQPVRISHGASHRRQRKTDPVFRQLVNVFAHPIQPSRRLHIAHNASPPTARAFTRLLA